MTNPDQPVLEIKLDRSRLPVSCLSSTLRALQAALRESARASEGTRQPFAQQPQPVLLVSTCVLDGELVMCFSFVDPFNSEPLSQLSAQVFREFLQRFTAYLKGLPQPGLWDSSRRGSRRRRYDSELTRRLDRVRAELRRLPGATLALGDQSVYIEGNRMEIN